MIQYVNLVVLSRQQCIASNHAPSGQTTNTDLAHESISLTHGGQHSFDMHMCACNVTAHACELSLLRSGSLLSEV